MEQGDETSQGESASEEVTTCPLWRICTVINGTVRGAYGRAHAKRNTGTPGSSLPDGDIGVGGATGPFRHAPTNLAR